MKYLCILSLLFLVACNQDNLEQNGLMVDHRIEFIARHYEIYAEIVELCRHHGWMVPTV